MDFEVLVFEHGQSHVEPYLHFDFIIHFMHDVLEVYLKVVEQVSDGLAFTTDVEVVHS